MPWLVVVGVLVAALSLRGPVIAVTPVLPEIIADLGIGSAAAGMLTTAPVLMFGAITPMAALVIRRAGPELALLASLCGVLLGTLVRALPGYGPMLVGMFIIGAGITIGNVVIPVIVRRDLPPERAALGTALYAATLNAGSLVTALATAPLSEAVGWSPALLVWGSFTCLGLVLWLVHIVRSHSWASADRVSGEPAPGAAGIGDVIADATGPLPVIVDDRVGVIVRRPIVWLLLGSFGLQSAMYYGLSTWLPTLLIDRTGATASEAGAMSSLFQGAAIAGALIAPILLRLVGAVASALTMGVCWTTMVLGLLLAPELAWLWASFGAIGHSAGFVIVFTALVRSSRSEAEAATMSALVQGAGYLLAASGAPVLGALHEASGGWRVPLTVVMGTVLVYTCGLVSSMAVAMRRR